MYKILSIVLSAALIVSCGSTPKNEMSSKESVNLATVLPTVVPSVGKYYLEGRVPLNKDFIALPFYFDGDVILENEFDLISWKNKRFMSVGANTYQISERYLIDLRKGNIAPVTDDIVFEGLRQSLLVKVMPFAKHLSSPDFIVLTHLHSEMNNSSILVLEDPVTRKVHGFIETAFVKL